METYDLIYSLTLRRTTIFIDNPSYIREFISQYYESTSYSKRQQRKLHPGLRTGIGNFGGCRIELEALKRETFRL